MDDITIQDHSTTYYFGICRDTYACSFGACAINTHTSTETVLGRISGAQWDTSCAFFNFLLFEI